MDYMKDYVNIDLAGYDEAEAAAYEVGARFVFPDFMTRVTAGDGGEAWLIEGSDKTLLFDCGMCYCAEAMVENLKKALDGRPLDYVVLSHTHYDHIGALPYVRKAFPEAEVCAAPYAKRVLSKDGAKATMLRLGQNAADLYGGPGVSKVIVEGLEVDSVIDEGDEIDLGGRKILVFATPGHTNCSLSYGIEPEHYLLASESTGVYSGIDTVDTAILKSFEDAIDSAEKLKAYDPNVIFSVHYGKIPPSYSKRYFDRFIINACKEKEQIESWYREGKTPEEIMELYRDYVYNSRDTDQQPDAAFEENAYWTIRLYAPEGRAK